MQRTARHKGRMALLPCVVIEGTDWVVGKRGAQQSDHSCLVVIYIWGDSGMYQVGPAGSRNPVTRPTAPSLCLALGDYPSQFHFFALCPQASKGIIRPGQGMGGGGGPKHLTVLLAPGDSPCSAPLNTEERRSCWNSWTLCLSILCSFLQHLFFTQS